MGPGDVCRVPLAVVRHGRARQSSGTGPCGDCRVLYLWVPGLQVSIRGEICFSEKPGVQARDSCQHKLYVLLRFVMYKCVATYVILYKTW